MQSLRSAMRSAASGDFTVRLGEVAPPGAASEIARDFDALASYHEALVRELRRLERSVGVEGRTSERAQLGPLSGSWVVATAAINGLVEKLGRAISETASTIEALSAGDLARPALVREALPANGELRRLAVATADLVGRLRVVTSSVSDVVREIGVEGRLGGTANVDGLSGTWRELVDDVNVLSSTLTSQIRCVATTAAAIAAGDLSQRIGLEMHGEFFGLKQTHNDLIDRLRLFAGEVSRVAREVGAEGKLGGQAEVQNAAGAWRELTENVNLMAATVTDRVRAIARVVAAVSAGELGGELVVLPARGEIEALYHGLNGMLCTLRAVAEQVTTVAREVGVEGKLGGQAVVPGAAGTWRRLIDSVNLLAGNLTSQVRNISVVTTAVARGDLSRTITVDARGEILTLKDTVNAMVEQLRTLASEVTRVAREVGTEGTLGGQARVPGASGIWHDLTESVNVLASNLSDQVRGISGVVTAVARGDLSKRLTLVARGESAALAETINDMIETLRTFADQVSTVAREVGAEGRLGGQARVPAASGTWRDLTDNVNQLAANLTMQVRAISEVAGAVIAGDLTRRIDVDARGEVLSLKDTINQMIANLRATTQSNKEQDWVKTNLTYFFGMMQGQRSVQSLAENVIRELAPVIGAQHGAFYLAEPEGERLSFILASSYAFYQRKHLANRFALGEGLVGQCALERKPIVVTDVPDGYVRITSALGEAPPRAIAVVPVFYEGSVRGVIELASFHEFSEIQITFLEQLMQNVGLALNLIGTSTRTEMLLAQLRRSNAELVAGRKELVERARLLEARNGEIAQTTATLKAKSEELARVSKYKSQFLTNMSHEIRTPLNSMMILAQLLAANEGKNLSAKQVDWAASIHAAGEDLLSLINQILDLSRVESGHLEVRVERCAVASIASFVEKTFRPVALQRGLELSVTVAATAPSTLVTDRQLLEQVLKNLVANAFKFTERGGVKLLVERAAPPPHTASAELSRASAAIAFAVSDTGVGIAPEHMARIFEAFEQGDASTTRKFGGTGLGLAISREYARLLGGDITVRSTMGEGSTFTLTLPLREGDERAADEPPKAAAPEPEAASPAEPDDRAALEGRRVLVAEDDARNLYAITGMLERMGIAVRAATDGREALDVLERSSDIDLVIMDVMMPGMDGLAAARTIRSDPRLSKLPLVALTAKASGSDRDACLAAGFDDFVVKPVDITHMNHVLAKLLRRT